MPNNAHFYNTTGQYYFQIISFFISWIDQWKVGFYYPIEYAVHEEVGNDTIVMYFHITMHSQE